MTSIVVHPFRQGAAERTRFGYLTGEYPRLERMQNTISAVCGYAAGLAITVMVVLTLADVAGRTLFDSPLGWTVSFIETHLMLAAAFFGMVAAYRSGAHVAVASVYNRFSLRIQKLLMLMSHSIVALGFTVLLIAGTQDTLFALETGQQALPGGADLPIPAAVWKAYIPIASALGLVLVLVDLFRELLSPWDQPSTDYDPGDLIEDVLPDSLPPAPQPSADRSPSPTELMANSKDAR